MSVTILPVPGNIADFGPDIASVDVDDAVVTTLTEWMPTYLRHVALKRDLDYALPIPKTYATTLDESEFLDHALPGVYVVTARTAEAPIIGDEGNYITRWLVAVSCVVRGRMASETRRTASLYELAARKALVQHGDLGDFATDTRWAGGGEARPMTLDRAKGRYLGEGASTFHVFTPCAVQDTVGPRVPDQDPYIPEGVVTSVHTDVVGVPITIPQEDA